VCPEGRVGEIWLASPSVATGYWGNGEATKETFGGRTAPDEGRAFCRTGDLGFLHDGGLYIAGRLKDLIIIRGRNHYPNDIEATVIESHSAIEASGCAAFAVESEDEERLVVLAELRRTARLAANVDAIEAAIKAAVLLQHEVNVHRVVLLQPGQLLKTSSGKVQRRANRAAFLEGSLRIVGPRRLQAEETPPADVAAAPAMPAQRRGSGLEDWIIAWISKRLNVPASTIEPPQSVLQLGRDSLVAIQFTRDLEGHLHRPVRVEQLWEWPTIAALAAALGPPAAAHVPACLPAGREEECVASPIEAPIGEPRALTPAPAVTSSDPALSLFFFSSSDDPAARDKDRLVREAAAFADGNGFQAVWFPERHFHRFGGLYPTPATLAAAAATWTRKLRLRAGSVVLPLHDPVRVAEEWSVVDNLSNGRVDLAF